MTKLENTKYYSIKVNDIPTGCKQCVKGDKLVLFVTGLCGSNCFFCPLSEQKKNKDVIYANERPITKDEEIIEEAKISQSKGAGITGGDPLVKLDRTIRIIKLLKKEFGKGFHIHLYTPLELVNEEKVKSLMSAGLNEIRFHPKIEDDKLWNKISKLKDLEIVKGIEIPVFPDKKDETIKLIKYLEKDINFVNLNELEVCECNYEGMEKQGYEEIDEITSAVNGSKETAIEIMQNLGETKLKIHFCTTKLKDKVQMGNRIIKRAHSIAKDYDKITCEGMLLRGVIYSDKLIPGVGYQEEIKKAQQEKGVKEEITKELKEIMEKIIKKFSLKKNQIEFDEKKLRLITRYALIKQIAEKIDNQCAIVEEYPTWDSFEISCELLERRGNENSDNNI
jgi:uncharacterized protein